MSELLLSKLKEESVQARTKMYDILSSLRRRGVMNVYVYFHTNMNDFSFLESDLAMYKYARERHLERPGNRCRCALATGHIRYVEEPVGVKNNYRFIFRDGVIFIENNNALNEFDISELLFELKFEGMK